MDKIKTRLRENYEDALFALLMDDYAQTEGERLYEENKNLKNDPALALPEGMEKRGIQAIRKGFRRKRTRSFVKTSGKIISRVAVVVLALNIAFGVSFFSVEAFRVEILNMALNYQATHTTVEFVGEDAASSSQYSVEDLQKVIPDTYTLDSYEKTLDAEYALFVDPDGKQIIWDVFPADTTFNLDTENADYVEEVRVGTSDAIIVEKDGASTILWCNTFAGKAYCISADMEQDDLLKIVTELTK